jgi:Asp-tRNA(Asn)/Glu-tRNA(Gln) amidotransferase A subunit family amidase
MQRRPASSATPSLTAVERSLSRIEERDGALRAWVHVDESAARRHASAIDADNEAPPLAGLTLGVKDIIDVGGLPCECGSAAMRGRRAFVDAAIVAQMKSLGMVVVGKTATTEFAFLEPAETRNPRDASRSPGGSSSGSAAAVADGHVDVALGTQTAGSILRPASFCGVVGYKPSFGTHSRAGILSTAPSLDTVGWFTKDLATTIKVRSALTGPAVTAYATDAFALCRTVHWSKADFFMRAGVERIAADLGARDADLPTVLDDMHQTIMQFEMRQELATVALQFPDLVSQRLLAFLNLEPLSFDVYRRAVDDVHRFDVEALFGQAQVLISPAACGEAVPFGSTGDPCFNRAATLLGLPAVTFPLGVGDAGLPLGIQLTARRGEDDMLLATAEIVATARRRDATR